MRRAKTQLFTRRASTAGASPSPEEVSGMPHASSTHHHLGLTPDAAVAAAAARPPRRERDPTASPLVDGSRSRIALSMGLKGLLSARRVAAVPSGADALDTGGAGAGSGADGAATPEASNPNLAVRSSHGRSQQSLRSRKSPSSNKLPHSDDLFKWGKRRRELFGPRAAHFQDNHSNALVATDAPPLRYSNSNLRVAGWLCKRGKRLGSRIDRFFRLNGSILSNSRSETSKPTWSVNVRGSKVLAGPGREIIFKMNKSFTSFYAHTDELHEKWIKALQAVSGNVTDYYDFGKLIGRGAYSEVFIARDKARNELCAVKVLERSNTEHAKLIDRELAVLRLLNHQNIVQIYDIFDSARETYVVMEYLAGGELLDLITESDHLSEKNSKQVIREVLQAVQYLHARGIVHRDVKPENILCVNRAWPLRVKLTDFGLSKMVGCAEDGTERVMRSQCGTAYYLAPEIANNLAYAKPVDLWACGVVLYVMLAGKFPFYGDTDEKFMRRLRGGVKFPEKEWAGISADAKALVRGLLDPSPGSRLTATQALQHRWLVGESDVTASSVPARAAGEAVARRQVIYDAALEPLSCQLAEFSSARAAAATTRRGAGGAAAANGGDRATGATTELAESESDILRTDDLERGEFGSVPASSLVLPGVGSSFRSNASSEAFGSSAVGMHTAAAVMADVALVGDAVVLPDVIAMDPRGAGSVVADVNVRTQA